MDANGQLTATAPSDLFAMNYINVGSGDALYTKYNDEWIFAQQEFLDNTQGTFPQSVSGITPWNAQVGIVPTPVSDSTRLWYNVATPGELQAVFNLPAATLNNKRIRLTADLDFNGYRFTALANATNANNFATTNIQFDGQ
ncbi:hypothetical protein [Eubacterium aggregans]|uniref:hypothetical protein n=1 Tax=Eubacterium aggregans TaxID=81409 RepID=UPI003F2D2637